MSCTHLHLTFLPCPSLFLFSSALVFFFCIFSYWQLFFFYFFPLLQFTLYVFCDVISYSATFIVLLLPVSTNLYYVCIVSLYLSFFTFYVLMQTSFYSSCFMCHVEFICSKLLFLYQVVQLLISPEVPNKALLPHLLTWKAKYHEQASKSKKRDPQKNVSGDQKIFLNSSKDNWNLSSEFFFIPWSGRQKWLSWETEINIFFMDNS